MAICRHVLLFFMILPVLLLVVTKVHGQDPKDVCWCSSDTCNCFNRNISDTKTQVLQVFCKSSLRTLIISDNNLTNLLKSGETFKDTACTNLETLKVRLNNLVDLNPGIFKGLGQLNELDLSFNELENLDVPQLFEPLSKLTVFKAASNKIVKLTSKTFKGLVSLTDLNLANNPITTIEQDTFANTPYITSMLLSSSPKSDVIKQQELTTGLFKYTPKLRQLNITSLGIMTLSKSTFEGLGRLDILCLSHNYIINVNKDALTPLVNLTIFDLSYNRLQCLQPSNFGNLVSLKQLDLSFNQLTYISNEAFKGLEQLHSINLEKNPIAVIEPRGLCSLRTLIVLRINRVIGKVKYETMQDYASSPFATLPTKTKIIGLDSKPIFGLSQPCNKSYTNLFTNVSTTTPTTSKCPSATADQLDERAGGAFEAPPGSRKYLLIIITLCVAFLVIAFAVIMTYRAWSRRKMHNEEDAEKQEMLERGGGSGTGHATANGNGGTTALISHPRPASNGAKPATSPTKPHETEGNVKTPTEGEKVVTDGSAVTRTSPGNQHGSQHRISAGLHPDAVVANGDNGDTTITTFGVV